MITEDYITEDYCSEDLYKLLLEKGFDGEIHTTYDEEGHIQPSISLYLAMKWLREEKRTSIIIEFDLTKRGYCPYVHQLDYDMDWVVKWRINTPMKYEEAIETALKYCLENLI